MRLLDVLAACAPVLPAVHNLHLCLSQPVGAAYHVQEDACCQAQPTCDLDLSSCQPSKCGGYISGPARHQGQPCSQQHLLLCDGERCGVLCCAACWVASLAAALPRPQGSALGQAFSKCAGGLCEQLA